MHRKLFLFLFFVSCSTTSVSAPLEPKRDAAPAEEASLVKAVAPEETIESLGKELDVLERKLLGYIPPLSPKQEDEVAGIKAQINAKETKRASMELKKMLEELKDEGE